MDVTIIGTGNMARGIGKRLVAGWLPEAAGVAQ
jgi:3-hydroxyisobutyrate dehydrogenase-like beta-hydroxyacid dehydrogenase